ncbi:MAG: response regulator [Candidatus Electrothrix gigas]
MASQASILIVDDKINNLIALEDTFSHIDAAFIKATSGNGALREVLRHDFALAILDVQMPEMDGYDSDSERNFFSI